ncbi:13853_t:CDS:2 [Rhizophagus irregularis]|nr:13853_t:CDS:2 [Rhizophagus irregularis]
MKRHDHTATIIDNKLYILGGSGYNGDHEFFYLDVSKKFNTKNLLWKDLSYNNIVPSHYGATSVVGGVNNNTLFLYGVYNSAMALVYTFDPKYNKWDNPQIIGDNTIRKQFLTGVIANNGKMYLFGKTLPNGLVFNDYSIDMDMLILDTINLNWEKGSLFNAPTGRGDYGATLLPNQIILYIGRFDIEGESAFPGAKSVIMFGGRGKTNLPKTDALYVLNTINFNWYIPKVTGDIPRSRFWHKANVMDNYMLISFGCCYNRQDESDILLLDISDNKEFKWVTEN